MEVTVEGPGGDPVGTLLKSFYVDNNADSAQVVLLIDQVAANAVHRPSPEEGALARRFHLALRDAGVRRLANGSLCCSDRDKYVAFQAQKNTVRAQAHRALQQHLESSLGAALALAPVDDLSVAEGKAGTAAVARAFPVAAGPFLQGLRAFFLGQSRSEQQLAWSFDTAVLMNGGPTMIVQAVQLLIGLGLQLHRGDLSLVEGGGSARELAWTLRSSRWRASELTSIASAILFDPGVAPTGSVSPVGDAIVVLIPERGFFASYCTIL